MRETRRTARSTAGSTERPAAPVLDRAHRAPLRVPRPLGRAQLGGRHLAGHLGPLRVRDPEPIDVAGRVEGRPGRRRRAARWRASGRASTSAAGTSARSRRSRPSCKAVVAVGRRALRRRPPAALGADQRAGRRRLHRRRGHGRACATRWRLRHRAAQAPERRGHARVLVFGAGEGAEQVITAMLRDPDSPYLPVAIVDDDPRKAGSSGSAACRCAAPAPTSPRWPRTRDAEVLLIAMPVGRRRPGPGAGPARPTRPGLQVLAVPAGARPLRRPASASTTSARSPPPTCSAAARSTPTSPASPTTSPAAGCSSPGPAARSAPSCAARCTASARPQLVMLDRDESAPPRRAALDRGPGPARRPATSWWPTSATASAWPRCSPSTGPRWCSTPPPSSTSRCARCTRARP